jgi:hypothetical protein
MTELGIDGVNKELNGRMNHAFWPDRCLDSNGEAGTWLERKRCAGSVGEPVGD